LTIGLLWARKAIAIKTARNNTIRFI
jgi:hypothetical protein